MSHEGRANAKLPDASASTRDGACAAGTLDPDAFDDDDCSIYSDPPESVVDMIEEERCLSEKPYIVVAGLARCGTSLTMQMLHAADIPCVGEWPAFEVDEINHRAVEPEFLNRYPGHALKVLDPHLTPLPPIKSGFLIWLDRNPDEQAKSQAKFTRIMMGIPPVNRAQMRRWAAALRRDRSPSLARFAGWPRLIMPFEEIIRFPHEAASAIAFSLQRWWPEIDPAAMAKQVRQRSPDCAAGLEIELALIAQAERAAS